MARLSKELPSVILFVRLPKFEASMINLSFPFTEEKIRALKVGDEYVDEELMVLYFKR